MVIYSAHADPQPKQPEPIVPSVVDPEETDVDHGSSPKLCISNCKLDGVGNNRMTRCWMCMNSFHYVCVNENPKSKSCFMCLFCRDIPNLICKLVKDMEQIKCAGSRASQSDLISRVDILTVENMKLKEANSELSEKVDRLTAEKLALEQEFASYKESIKKSELKHPPGQSDASNPNRILLTGSSVIRNIEAKDSNRSTVRCIRGAKQSEIIEHLVNDTLIYEKVLLVCGGNDCSDENRTTKSIIDERQKLIQEAKKHAKTVTISSNLPRPVATTQLKIDIVNKATKDLCNSDPCLQYICNDTCFKLADQLQNEALFVRDAVHPNFLGSNKLLYNLDLQSLMMVKRWSPGNQGNRSQQLNYYSMSKQFPPVPGQFPQFQQPPQNMWMNRMPQQARPALQPGTSSPTCVWCRSSEHPASNCPSRGSRVCYRCGSTFHSIRWCVI